MKQNFKDDHLENIIWCINCKLLQEKRVEYEKNKIQELGCNLIRGERERELEGGIEKEVWTEINQ